ncbi:MAG: choline-sulfatase, partial [Mesorhizobium sp.]
SHPHDPYVARKQYWDLYEHCQALDPETPFIPYDEQDTHSQRLYHASDYASFEITDEQVRRSRRGYFANISYVDDKLGELLDVLKRTRMLDDTTILFCS